MLRIVFAVLATLMLSACQRDLANFVAGAEGGSQDSPSTGLPVSPPPGTTAGTGSVSSGGALMTSTNLGMTATLAPRDKQIAGAQVGMTVRLEATR